MEHLNFPIIRRAFPDPQSLSMDDYLLFIEFNLDNVVPKENILQAKESTPVRVPFRLR